MEHGASFSNGTASNGPNGGNSGPLTAGPQPGYMTMKYIFTDEVSASRTVHWDLT